MKEAIYQFLLGLFGNILWDLFLAGVFGSILAWLAKKKSEWANPVLYFLITAFCVFGIGYTIAGRPLLVKDKVPTSVDNVQERLESTLRKYSYRPGLVDEDGSYFAYEITIPSTEVVARISRSKKRELDKFLFITTNLFNAQELEKWNNMSKSQKDSAFYVLVNSLIAHDIGLWNLREGPERWKVAVRIPITETTGDKEFLEALAKMDFPITLVEEILK